MTEYEKFLSDKVLYDAPTGLKNIADINSHAFPFQKDIIRWALRRGRAAIFADCGLGKTLMQLEWARQIPGDVLILAPLAVAAQTALEGGKFGIKVTICRTQDDVSPGVNITNYEMLSHFDSSKFLGVVLDESSILKSFTGTTKRELMAKFKTTEFKLACTATPAPNDYLELGNHADFLNVMRSNEMISRFFINDSMQAGNYRLKEHARAPFWKWVSSWATCISKPSDFGYPDDGFNLPALNNKVHIVGTSDLPPVEGELFRIADMSATSIHKELRATAAKRARTVADLVNKSKEPWIVWINTNYEADAIMPLIPGAVEIRGDDPRAEKEKCLTEFINNRIRVLITKSSIAGFGVNLQCCRNMAFMGLSYSYESYYQATRRCWRFGQKKPVNVHIICADSEARIMDVIAEKEKEHIKMKKEMVSNMGNNEAAKVHIKAEEMIAKGENWTLMLGDCVTRLKEIESNSLDFSIFSPPFSNLYIYSDHPADMGNNRDDESFMAHFKFAVQELFRATRNGRLAAIHCKDLPLYKNRDGAAGLKDFPGDLIRLFESCGWTFHSRVTIWKDPVIEMQRTKNHGLLYKQLCKDSAASRQGMADYMVVMRKWGDGEENPVTRNNGERFFDYVGMSGPAARELKSGRSKAELDRIYSIDCWQRYASPVWFDIQQTNVLNKRPARSEKDEKHICPLQLDVIERSIELWSNPNDLVFSPFAGIGSEGYQAIKQGRRFLGIELKESYFKCAANNLKAAELSLKDGLLI